LTDRRRLPSAEFPQFTLPHPDPFGGGHEAAEGFILGSASVAIVPQTLLARADEVIE
jgi:hypothetical protein